LAAFATGYLSITLAQLSVPSFTIVQLNATLWQGIGRAELGSEASYAIPPIQPYILGEASEELSYEFPPRRLSPASISYGLRFAVIYPGTFHINQTWIANPIAPGQVGANRVIVLNVSVYSPYGYLDELELYIGQRGNLSRRPSYLVIGILPSSFGGDPLGIYVYDGSQWIKGSDLRVESGIPKANFSAGLLEGKTITRIALEHSGSGWEDPTDIWIWDDRGNLLYSTTVDSHVWDQSRPNYFEYVEISYTPSVEIVGDLAKYVCEGNLYEEYDPYNLFDPLDCSWTIGEGWVNATIRIRSYWESGGIYDFYLTAVESTHDYYDDLLYENIKIVNSTMLWGFSFNKTLFFPNDPVKLLINVAYNGTSVGAEGEVLWVNGTQLTTDPTGMAIYEFIAPDVTGTYTLNVTLAHGKTYFINFTVSSIILHLYTKTETNETIHLPSDLLVQVYNYTTNELIGEYVGREVFDVPFDITGTYLLKIWYHDMLIAEVVHDQTGIEQFLTITPIKQLADHLGRIRGLLANVSLASYSYDNDTRRLNIELGGNGMGRLVYILNYTKPLLVLSNTTVTVQQLEGELVIDASLPANITILDPRKIKVVIENPYGISYALDSLEFYNLTAWEPLLNASVYEVPAQQETVIRASYKGVEVKKKISLLDDVNVTLVLSYDKFADYKGASREIVANASIVYESLSAKHPYSRVRILVSGSGGFKLKMFLPSPPTELGVTSNATVVWGFEDGWLTIEGVLGSIAELNITDFYKLRLELYDRFNRTMPSWAYAYINETEYTGSVIEALLYPEDYEVKVPEVVNGFQFYSFFDGFNAASRHVMINGSDVILKAWYRIPVTTIAIEPVKVKSAWWGSVFSPSQDERISVYFDIYLKDYFGEPVPSRPITVWVIPEGMETGWLFNLTTDASGYARTPAIELSKYRDYLVKVEFAGDDIYAVAEESLQLAGEELLELPEQPAITDYLLLLIPLGLTIAIVLAIAKVKHVLPSSKRRRVLREIDWSPYAG